MDWEAILARGALLLAALAGGYLAALWVVLVVWTYRDVEARSRNVVTQVAATLLAVLFWVPGVLLYLILRPKDTLDNAFQRSLEEEYLLQDLEELPVCPSCQHYVEDDFILCPHCHTNLRDSCGGCGRLVALRWSLCPYCGAAQDDHAARPARIEAPAARWTAPALRRRRAVPTVPTGAPVVALPRGDDYAAEPSVRTEPAALSVVPGAKELVRRLDRFRPPATGTDAVDSDQADDAAPALPAGNGRVAGATPLAPRGRFRVGGNGHGTNGHAANGHRTNGHAHAPGGDEPAEDEAFAPAERTPVQVEGD